MSEKVEEIIRFTAQDLDVFLGYFAKLQGPRTCTQPVQAQLGTL